MIRKLDRWVWVGGALLAANGGLINAVGLSCFAHQTVSHVTGTTTLFSLALMRHNYHEVAYLGGVLGSFVLGAAIAGFVVQNNALQLGRRYAAALWIECAIIAVGAAVIESRPFLGLGLAAAACGLQNAMASTYSGATLRTTHMTGIITDLGAALGHLLRGIAIDSLRVRLHGILLGSFVTGAVVGGWLFDLISYRALLLPVGLTAIVAIVYSFYIRPASEPRSAG